MAGVTTSGVDVTCPVCYDTFTAPRFLPCHHTLCTDCVSDLMERAAPLDHFLCPLCQLKVPVPEEGVTSFQINFYLAPLLAGQVNVSGGQPPAREKPCQHCPPSTSSSSPKGAVATCQQCRVALCRTCIDTHLKESSSSRHTFAPVKRTPESSPSSSFDLSCEAHATGGGDLTYFCRTCSALVCQPDCPQHQGQGHALVSVAAEAQGQRSEMRRQLLSLTTLQGALADLEDECGHRVVSLEDSCRQVSDKMAAAGKSACGAVTSRAGRAEDKVRGLRGRISAVVTSERTAIKTKIAALSALLTSANDVMAGSDAHFLRHKTKLKARIQSAMSKVPPSRGNVQFSFKISRDVQSLISSDSSFGHTTVQFQSPVLRHKMQLTSTKQERKLRKLAPGADGGMMAAVGNCLVYVGNGFAETKRLEFPAEIVDVLPAEEGKVFVVLAFPHSVKVLDTRTDVAKDFVSPLNLPTATTFNNKQELVFASNDGKELSLTFYAQSGNRLKRVTLPLPDFVPISIALSQSGQLFLCSPTDVLCLDADYSPLSFLSEPGQLEPRCLSGLPAMGSGVGDVLVANRATGNVEVVDLNQGTLTSGAPLVRWERGTSDGEDLSRGLLPNISCAVVDPAGKLWVGQEDGQVYIYDWLLRAS